MITQKIPHLFYGGDYNPEQWPREVWREDIRLMQEAQVNFVSVGIFSWARLQPKEGVFDFDWLDELMDLLHEGGIGVNLATATASPSAWLVRKDPKVLPEDPNGQTYYPGSRQHYCPNSKTYQEASRALVRALAERYGQNPALVSWHVNNEYGCHFPACYCDVCAENFRVWLAERYGTVEALNGAWGTAFWSQAYGEWAEIFPPRKMPTHPNPTQLLDYQRFMNESFLRLYKGEVEILREVTPEVPVNTNFMAGHKPLDYFKWGALQDFTSHDAYPDPKPGEEGEIEGAMANDLTRSFNKAVPMVLMEQVSSQVNWRGVNTLKAPGQMRLWSLQAVAHGAEGVLFFQWRASRAGAEKFHGAMVPHVDPAKSRVFQEIKGLGEDLSCLDDVIDSRIQAECGIVFSYENWWALEAGSKPRTFLYHPLVKETYTSFWRENLPVDFIAPGEDLSKYRLLVVPSLYLFRDEWAEWLREWVRAGGVLVVTYFSAVVNEKEHIHLGGYGSPISDLLGLWVEEWQPLHDDERVPFRFEESSRREEAVYFTEKIHLEGARSMAHYTEGPFAGSPALTVNDFGKGKVFYQGARFSAGLQHEWLGKLADEIGIHAPLKVPVGVELTVRTKGDREFLFFLNHQQKTVAFSLGSLRGRELLTGQDVAESLSLPPFGVAVIERREG